jgi:predicted alpha/beta-fold hydrolase
VADRIRVPALIVSAGDDPFVPVAQFRDAAIRDNPNVHVLLPRHGGHCGFVGQPAEDDGYWAETSAIQFIAERLE